MSYTKSVFILEYKIYEDDQTISSHRVIYDSEADARAALKCVRKLYYAERHYDAIYFFSIDEYQKAKTIVYGSSEEDEKPAVAHNPSKSSLPFKS